MARRLPAEIQTAINECLALCRQKLSPLSGLMEYIVKLRAEKWDVEDIRTMETAVVRILVELARNKERRTRVDDED